MSYETPSQPAFAFTLAQLYADLRARKLVRVRESTAYAPKLVRKVLGHPALAEINRQLSAGFRGKAHRRRWLFQLNFRHPFRYRLSWVHLEAYMAWENLSRPGTLPPPAEPMVTSMGAGDGSGGGRKRLIRTPGSQELYASHGLEVLGMVVSLAKLLRLVEEAPEEHRQHLRRLTGGLAGRLPAEPSPELAAAVAWLYARLKNREGNRPS